MSERTAVKTTFRFKSDRRTRRLTRAIAAALGLLLAAAVGFSRSGYFSIWLAVFVLLVLALAVLSIPRKVVVTDRALEIRCTVELTSLPLQDVASIRRMEPGEMKFTFPVLAGYGFFGYYGWFYNFSEMSIFKVYAARWRDFVRIDSIYEDIYVVDCADPDALIDTVRAARRERMAALAGVGILEGSGS